MKQREWLATLGVSVAVLIAVGACSDTSGGEPNVAETTKTSLASNSNPSSRAERDAGNPFEGMVACDVFDKALDKIDDWDFPEGEPDDTAGDNGCGSAIPQKVSVGLTLQPGGTLKDFGDDPSKLYNGDIKGRSAVEKRDGYADGSCMLAMSVGANDRALLAVTSNTMSRDEGCDLVEDIARQVEPMLPEEPS